RPWRSGWSWPTPSPTTSRRATKPRSASTPCRSASRARAERPLTEDPPMGSYFAPTMRLYLERLVDWPTILRLRSGGTPDVAGELGAFRTVLETTAQLAESFERPARENWEAEAELTEDGGARPPAHI